MNKDNFKIAYDEISQILCKGFDDLKNLENISNTPFFYGGLNIVYGKAGSGKSWQLAKLISKTNDEAIIVYLDSDGSNGGKFVNHCKSNNIIYASIGKELIKDIEWNSLSNLKKVIVAMNKIHSRINCRIIFIIDSLSSILEGADINNSQNISPILYKLNNKAEELDCSIVIVDHSTNKTDLRDGKIVDFKIEGNESAKLRATCSVCKYIPFDYNSPDIGGKFIVERSRDQDLVKKSSEYNVENIDPNLIAYEWFKEKIGFDEITKSTLTSKTKNKKDLWLRDYIKKMFTSSQDGNKTTMKLLKEDSLKDLKGV